MEFLVRWIGSDEASNRLEVGSLRIAVIISGDRLWSSWSAGLAMTRLLTGWRPYKALIHVDRLHEYLLGLLETPKLTKDNLGIEEVNKFIVHIHILIRAYTFDD